MLTKEEMTPDEIRKARYREYYYAHREEICRKNRERYNALDKEVRAARSRKYLREHYEEHLAASSRYHKTHREKMRGYFLEWAFLLHIIYIRNAIHCQ